MKFTDKNFKSLFSFLITLSLSIFVILALSTLLLVPIQTKSLWIGAGIVFVGINIFLNLKKLAWKAIALGITGITMTMFLNTSLTWSLEASFYFSAAIITIAVLFYMTFAS